MVFPTDVSAYFLTALLVGPLLVFALTGLAFALPETAPPCAGFETGLGCTLLFFILSSLSCQIIKCIKQIISFADRFMEYDLGYSLLK